MSTYEFTYKDPKKVHVVPFCPFKDSHNDQFEASNLIWELNHTEFVHVDENGNELSRTRCNVGDWNGPVFKCLEGDYTYLRRWYHNPHRKSNTRHGSYVMLYLTEDGYQWKLSQSFIEKILTIPDNITDLFDFG